MKLAASECVLVNIFSLTARESQSHKLSHRIFFFQPQMKICDTEPNVFPLNAHLSDIYLVSGKKSELKG